MAHNPVGFQSPGFLNMAINGSQTTAQDIGNHGVVKIHLATNSQNGLHESSPLRPSKDMIAIRVVDRSPRIAPFSRRLPQASDSPKKRALSTRFMPLRSHHVRYKLISSELEYINFSVLVLFIVINIGYMVRKVKLKYNKI